MRASNAPDWAVLSACNTAATEGTGAEAVSGLGRACFYAGTRAPLVSNWPVHSEATKELITDYQLSAIPLVIFMATMLGRAGVIEELFDMVYKILGSLKGGLAASTIIASTILAAMAGVIGATGATEVKMGILALPAMLKRNYHPTIAYGSILAGGTLGRFLDWVGILLLAVLIFVPLMKTLTFDGVFGLPGVDPQDIALWFGVVYMVNMQMSFLSPPFG